MEEDKDRIGPILRGQSWVELCGTFTIEELRLLIEKINDMCRGLEEKDGSKE